MLSIANKIIEHQTNFFVMISIYFAIVNRKPKPASLPVLLT